VSGKRPTNGMRPTKESAEIAELLHQFSPLSTADGALVLRDHAGV
jgi:hypothetical protein